MLDLKPDGIFISNGPGDPNSLMEFIPTIQALLGRVPIFGICLGHQLLSLASGATTEKMKFGHHGANHPVQDLATGQVLITSQNHGFTVSEDSIGDNMRVTHRSLFDGTVQGIERLDRQAFLSRVIPKPAPVPGTSATCSTGS